MRLEGKKYCLSTEIPQSINKHNFNTLKRQSVWQRSKIILRLIPGLKALWYRNWIYQKSTLQPLLQKTPGRDGFIEGNLCYLKRIWNTSFIVNA